LDILCVMGHNVELRSCFLPFALYTE